MQFASSKIVRRIVFGTILIGGLLTTGASAEVATRPENTGNTDRTIRIVPLKHINVSAANAIIQHLIDQQALPPIGLTVDSRTNSLILSGTLLNQQTITKLVDQLD